MEDPPVVETPTRCQNAEKFLKGLRFKLYCSYFLSARGDRMRSFAFSIALGVIGGDMQFTAASGLINSIMILLFASVVGGWVDKTSRLKAARIALITHTTTVAFSMALLAVIMLFSPEIRSIWNGTLSILMISFSIVLCAFSVLANVGTRICITKDWVVAICGSDKEKLAGVNAVMVRIDMAAMVLSSLLAGQVMTSFGTGWGCAFIGFWYIGSFIIEYYMLSAVYRSCPELAVKGYHSEGIAENAPSAQCPVQKPARCAPCHPTLRTTATSLIDGYRSYFRQSVLPAGLALASLYLTVLSFDGITNVYVLSLGMPENMVGLCRGIGAIMGIVGSVIYPQLRRRVGVIQTGLISLIAQWMCLLLAVASVWLPGSNFDPVGVFGGSSNSEQKNREAVVRCSGTNRSTDSGSMPCSKYSLAAFVTGIVLSRVGLFMADISISQTFQEHVVEHERGVISGVQNSLNGLTNIAKSVLVIALPNPSTFGILIIISWLAAFAGFISYCYYYRKQRRDVCVTKDCETSANEVPDGSKTAVVATTEGNTGELGSKCDTNVRLSSQCSIDSSETLVKF